MLSMKKFDKILIGLFVGGAPPILFCMVSVMIWFYLDKLESRALIYVTAGFFLGSLIDLKFLRGWINDRYKLPVWFVTGIYLFYNIGIYGLFMGFPVFNLILGLFAGYYFGKKIGSEKISWDQHKKIINQVSLFTGLVMTLNCISSGFIALAGKGVGKDIQGMLGLGFEVTRPMIWSITLIGGIVLILIQILLTKITMIKTIKNSGNK